MGLFDHVVFSGSTPNPKCAVGHDLDGFQTKSFDSAQATYYVHHNQLYKGVSFFQDENPDERYETNSDTGELRIIRVSRAKAIPYTGTIEIYSHCRICHPVLFIEEFSEMVRERRPWNEFRISFENGQWRDMAAIKQETRDEIRSALEKNGLLVLRDDETIARARFLKQKGKPVFDF